MLKGYADVHVKWAILQGLRARGMEIVRAQDRGRDKAADLALLQEAGEQQRAILTNDPDFLRLAADLQRRGKVFAPIIFWPQQKRVSGVVMRRILAFAATTTYADACSLVHYVQSRFR